ncbi:MAG TPA: tetratricopeptide repeat protein [Thermoanaerobaculia bacterium]|nr:tetratricopeptide repeat protein [Thermoanaerobaculia bacterium]
MADGSPDRLSQLRARWQTDPSSRIFLQLAEELRHLGRVKEALDVLETGLKEHPGYLSALVAKGRCLLELGEPERAGAVLERVVQQDPTQMVANKLLVRAYIGTGDPERARQRLDLYRLLNDSDPEIEELRRRVAAMDRSPQAADGPRPEESAERPRMDPSRPPREGPPQAGAPAAARTAAGLTPPADVFDLGPAPAAPAGQPDDLFALERPAAAAQPAPSPREAAAAEVALAALSPTAPTAPTAGTAAATAARPAVHPRDAAAKVSPPAAGSHAGKVSEPLPLRLPALGTAEPFPDPAPERSRRLYLASLQAEGIFAALALALEGGPAVEKAALALQQAADLRPRPAPEARPEPAGEEPEEITEVEPWSRQVRFGAEAPPATAPGAPPAAAAAFAGPSPAAAAPQPAEGGAGPATATLGELYLRQGHLAEAERIFQEVLRREPGNQAARQALAGIESRRRPLDAAGLLAELDQRKPDAGPKERKRFLLLSYLQRLRPAGSGNVS